MRVIKLSRRCTRNWVLSAHRTYTSCSAHQDQDQGGNNDGRVNRPFIAEFLSASNAVTGNFSDVRLIFFSFSLLCVFFDIF